MEFNRDFYRNAWDHSVVCIVLILSKVLLSSQDGIFECKNKLASTRLPANSKTISKSINLIIWWKKSRKRCLFPRLWIELYCCFLKFLGIVYYFYLLMFPTYYISCDVSTGLHFTVFLSPQNFKKYSRFHEHLSFGNIYIFFFFLISRSDV